VTIASIALGDLHN